MKCYFREKEEWTKGEILSLRGDSELHFYENNINQIEPVIKLYKCQIIFTDKGFVVTGYRATGNLFEVVSVEVRITYPKKGWKK